MATVDEIGDLFDSHLLELLKKGKREVLAGDQVKQVDLSSSDLSVIERRLKACGVVAADKAPQTLGELKERLEGITLPEFLPEDHIDDEEDA